MLAHRWTWRTMDQKRNLERNTVVDANLICHKFRIATQIGRNGHFSKGCLNHWIALWKKIKLNIIPTQYTIISK